MCMIYSHCPLWANRLSDFSPNQSLILSLNVLLCFSVHLSPALSIPLYLHFLWPLNTSLKLLEPFLNNKADFHTSAVPLINYTETGWGEGERVTVCVHNKNNAKSVINLLFLIIFKYQEWIRSRVCCPTMKIILHQSDSTIIDSTHLVICHNNWGTQRFRLKK